MVDIIANLALFFLLQIDPKMKQIRSCYEDALREFGPSEPGMSDKQNRTKDYTCFLLF